MYEPITYPYRPHPDQVFRPAGGPTIAKWSEHRTRRIQVAERGGDIHRHPWRGVRQGGSARGLFQTTARQVDRELALVPYHVRRTLPKSGAYPVVRGFEEGTGPNPFIASAPTRLSRSAQFLQRQKAAAAGRPDPAPSGELMVSKQPVDRDVANIIIGPYAPTVQDQYYQGHYDYEEPSLGEQVLDAAAIETGASAGATAGELLADYGPGALGAGIGAAIAGIPTLGAGAGAGAAIGFGIGNTIGNIIKPFTKPALRGAGRTLGAHAGRAIAAH